MTSLQQAERLRHNILFETIDDDLYGAVKSAMGERRYAAGELILEDESEGEELFLLVEGRVKILKKTRFGDEKLLALLHPGDFFGELELVDGRPRSARVVAEDPTLTYTLKRKDFEKLLASSHPFTLRLMQVLSLRLRALNNNFIVELERTAERTIGELGKLEKLIEATKVLNSTLDLDKLLMLILDTALKIVNGDRGTVYLVDEANNRLWSKIYRGAEQTRIELPIGKGIAGYVAATGDVLNITDAYLDPRFNPDFDRKSGFRTKTILCMPMRNKDHKIIGVFQLLNKRKGVFTTDDESFIDALSLHAALAVENARLYEQERRRLVMEKDLFAAREVQMGLIPRNVPVLRNFDVAAFTRPAKEVGGDFYDFIRIDSNRCELVVADVAGKGLPAALLASLIKGVLFSQSMQSPTPADHLRGSNRIVRANFPRKSFITVVLACVDDGAGTVTVANAGHCFPIRYRARDCSAVAVPVKGMALNLEEKILCEERTIAMETGDSIVLYTDGVPEAQNSHGEFFGPERLEAVVAAHGSEAAETLVNAIVQNVDSFCQEAPQHDDVTVVVVKADRRPGSPH